MDSYTRDGLTFDVSDAGPEDGPIVVLLHGFPQNRHEWAGLTPRLTAAGYRVLAPDQRGYSPGARPKGRRAYAMPALVDDVLALIDAAGAKRVHLVGHDWGAGVAWALASYAPQRLQSLTAVSVPHTGAFLWAMPRGQLLKSWYMGVFQLPALPERLVVSPAGVRLLTGHGLTEDQVRGYLAPLGRDGLTAALNWYRALPFALSGAARAQYGRKVSVPTLYVWSDQDVALTRKGAEATERFVTGPYRFEVFPGSHWIPDEQPDRLADVLLEHLQQYA